MAKSNNISHTISIELKNGDNLIYALSEQSKNLFYDKIIASNRMSVTDAFIWFYANGDRLVFVNTASLIKILFLFDVNDQSGSYYFDNFSKVYIDSESELNESVVTKKDLVKQRWYNKKDMGLLPAIIISDNKEKALSALKKGESNELNQSIKSSTTCWDLRPEEFDGFLIDIPSKDCFARAYLHFSDDDGEENLMPTENIILVEMDRNILLSDKKLVQLMKRE